MASLVKKCSHPRSSWDTCGCAFYLRVYSSGRSRLTNVGPDRTAAERALARHGTVAAETVSQAIDAWLTVKGNDPAARPNSLSVYRSRAKHIKAILGDIPVRSLRPEHLTKFTVKLLATGRAPATVEGIYAALTAALKHAVRRGVIPAVPRPVDGPGIPSVAPRSHELTIEQLNAVLSEMPGVWGRVAELILLTGLRWGEAVAIEPGDIEGHVVRIRRTRNRQGLVNPPKTKSSVRVVPLSPDAQAILNGLQLPVGGDYRDARKALVAALGDLYRPGMGYHTLRHAHATLLDSAGIALREQAARLGHGVNYSQSLAYGLASQAGDADVLDVVRQRHAGASSESPRRDELQERRARRAARGD